jgi:hypothetical protein
MVFDSTRGVAVLIGGWDHSTLRPETWEWNGAAWSDATPGGSEGAAFPEARFYHGMAFDSVRGKTVLHAGADGTEIFDDTWEWDGSAWIFLSGSSGSAGAPPMRAVPSLVYDRARSVAVMYGGYTGAYLTDLWTWNGVSWSQAHPGANPGVDCPGRRYMQAAAYDSVRGVMVLSGGYRRDPNVYYTDTWEWNGTAWTDVSPAGAEGVDFPAASVGPSMTYDSYRGVVLFFGGADRNSVLLNEIWEWDGTAWTNVTPAGAAGVDLPEARQYAALAYDTNRRAAVLFGGYDGVQVFDDTWEWDGTAWTKASPAAAPDARCGHSMAYDPWMGVALLFGGTDVTDDYGDTWTWNGTDWTDVSPSGVAPIAPVGRSWAGMTFHESRERIMLFGGSRYDVSMLFNDTWEY